MPSGTKFWCKVGIIEKYVLISLIIFSVLYLLFLIFSILIHKKCFFKLNYKNGESILYKNLIVIHSIRSIIIFIFVGLSLYLCPYTFFANPSKKILFDESWAENNPEINELEKNWKNNKAKHYFNIPIQFLLFFLLLELA